MLLHQNRELAKTFHKDQTVSEPIRGNTHKHKVVQLNTKDLNKREVA